jgi:hypothetical protein
MTKKIVGAVAILAAIGFAAYLGFQDGREHQVTRHHTSDNRQ